MSDDVESVGAVRKRDEARLRFDAWRAVFVSALEGAAGSDKLIAQIIDDASAIADAAVARIAARVPKDSGR